MQGLNSLAIKTIIIAMIMQTSYSGIEFIKNEEGFRSEAYKCPAGVWTIGYGHTKNVKSTDIITEYQGELFLKEDIQFAESEINKQNLNINQNQFDALVSFTFNVGIGNFRRSTLLKKIKANPNDATIKNEFHRWKFASGKPLLGLEKRRAREANLYFKA